MLPIKILISIKIILGLLIGLRAIAEPILVVKSDSNAKDIGGVIAASDKESLFLVTQQLPDIRTAKDATYILESRTLGDLENVNWSRNLSELSEVREMFESVEHLSLAGPAWHVLPQEDSLYLVLNRSAVAAVPSMSSVLYRLNREGDIAVVKVLEPRSNEYLQPHHERVVNLDFHARGIIVSLGYGIKVLNHQDFSEIANWQIKDDESQGWQSFSMVISSHVNNDEIFLLGATIQGSSDAVPIWIKRLSIYPALTLLNDVQVTTTSFMDMDKFNLATHGDIIAVVGVNKSSRWTLCESIKLESFSCEEISFPSLLSDAINTQGIWHSSPPNIIEIPDGYMWTMRWRLSGILVGKRSMNGTDVYHYEPQSNRHSGIGRPYLFTMHNKEPFVLVNHGHFFDGHMYISTQIHKISY